MRIHFNSIRISGWLACLFALSSCILEWLRCFNERCFLHCSLSQRQHSHVHMHTFRARGTNDAIENVAKYQNMASNRCGNACFILFLVAIWIDIAVAMHAAHFFFHFPHVAARNLVYILFDNKRLVLRVTISIYWRCSQVAIFPYERELGEMQQTYFIRC